MYFLLKIEILHLAMLVFPCFSGIFLLKMVFLSGVLPASYFSLAKGIPVSYRGGAAPPLWAGSPPLSPRFAVVSPRWL